MYIEVQGNDVDMAQAFQWLQEKTLFAAGAVLWNPAPGIEFAACDLVRNALVSSFLRRSFGRAVLLKRSNLFIHICST